jgi:hypothetical protein
VFDVADPARPSQIGQFPTEAPATKVLLQGQLAYLVAGTAGLYVVNVSNAQQPVLVGRYQPDDALSSVVVSAGRAYVGGRRGLYVLDVTDPSQPSEIGKHQLPEPVQTISLVDRYAYVHAFESDRGPDFFVLDVSDPAHISEVMSLAFYRWAAATALVGRYLLAAGEDGVNVFDISRPERPRVVNEHAAESPLHYSRDL